jgi:hypothetical protein
LESTDDHDDGKKVRGDRGRCWNLETFIQEFFFSSHPTVLIVGTPLAPECCDIGIRRFLAIFSSTNMAVNETFFGDAAEGRTAEGFRAPTTDEFSWNRFCRRRQKLF